MPRRSRRRRRSSAVTWSPDLDLMLRIGPPPMAPPLDVELLRAAWEHWGDAVVERAVESGAAAPWVFWHCSPDVPESLRSDPTESPLIELGNDVERDRRADLEARRRAWWADHMTPVPN